MCGDVILVSSFSSYLSTTIVCITMYFFLCLSLFVSLSVSFLVASFDGLQPVLVTSQCSIRSLARQINSVRSFVRRVRRSLDSESAATLVHASVTSCIDYCHVMLAGVPKTMIDKLQRILNAAAGVVSGTRKFDLSAVRHSELHWIEIREHRLWGRTSIILQRTCLSCAWSAADGWPLMWINRPL